MSFSQNTLILDPTTNFNKDTLDEDEDEEDDTCRVVTFLDLLDLKLLSATHTSHFHSPFGILDKDAYL